MSFLTLFLNIYTVHNILPISKKLKQEYLKFGEMNWDEKIGDTHIVPIFTPVPYPFS